ncbi:NAD-dependent epimerase/dehydratase family protein [Candidatus Marinimicrobia bacterium]|nr:NAD-dependent epimerase/dehydratase family protein [Candidatus Neomarinimicrobiota bacterium]
MKNKILITGCAGFIGMHLSKRLLDRGSRILGVDNLNDYYDVTLKKNRLSQLKKYSNFKFEKIDIADLTSLEKLFKIFKPDIVVNLAAQAGVRYSIENPNAYIHSNIMGFMNILECCRYNRTSGLIYASSSSVYGANKKTPFSVHDTVNRPISIYAATKRANELMASTYSSLYGLRTTGLRFFTVYGPWGRPDMAMYIFAEKILKNQTIRVFNHGKMERDFTYIDDIINGIESSIERNYSCEVFNLGNNKVVQLKSMIEIIENELEKKAVIQYEDIQLGDVKKTCADIKHSIELLNYKPTVNIQEGIIHFLKWFKDYESSNGS